MKLIEQNSILKNLPLTIGNRQMLILDSLRFLFEMIDYSYEKLREKLLDISKGKPDRNAPEIFGDAWSIIDNSIRVVNICKQLPWEYPDQILGHLYYIKEFRNTFQHLDERIDESLLKSQSPFIGVISWSFKFLETNKINLYQLISGNLIVGPNAKQTVHNLDSSREEINKIYLHTVDRKANSIETDIDELIVNLKKLVSEFELRFKDLTPMNWSKRQDVLLCFENGNPHKNF